jgi:hypothetical protein
MSTRDQRGVQLRRQVRGEDGTNKLAGAKVGALLHVHDLGTTRNRARLYGDATATPTAALGPRVRRASAGSPGQEQASPCFVHGNVNLGPKLVDAARCARLLDSFVDRSIAAPCRRRIPASGSPSLHAASVNCGMPRSTFSVGISTPASPARRHRPPRQGRSSCPSADELLRAISTREPSRGREPLVCAFAPGWPPLRSSGAPA